MASVARCGIEGCHEHAKTLCTRCEEPVCGIHSTINDVCFECALGMNSAAPETVDAHDPAMIWWVG